MRTHWNSGGRLSLALSDRTCQVGARLRRLRRPGRRRQGLLHVSEMGWSRVSDASQIVAAGEEITVKVLRVDERRRRLPSG